MKPFLTTHHPSRAAEYYRQGLWTADTFYGLLCGHAAARPDVPAIRDGRTTVSWLDLKRSVDGVADDLRGRGLTRGDRVSIWMSNRAEAVVMFLACSREGFACNPSLHKSHTFNEICRLLTRLDAKALLTEERWGADGKSFDYDTLRSEVPSLKVLYTPEGFPAPAMSSPPLVMDADDVVYLAFTSGTTGAPKCVMHSHNTLLANARDLVRDWGHGRETILLSLSPLSHHIAWVAVAQWLITGCRFVTDDPPAGMTRLDWIEEIGATYVMGVPTHAVDILSEQARHKQAALGSVSVFYMAGAPIPPTVATEFVRQGIRPQNVYGMTENSSHQYTHADDDTQVVVATCGRGGKAYEVRIFDQENPDREIGPGQIGQIGGRGAALMLGYFANQKATEDSFNRDGWFMSGDLGVLDEAGNLRIEGRLKDLIIRGGHNIHPSHIEFAALTLKDVTRAAAIPVADDRLGERVCLAVCGDVGAAEILEHLRAQGVSKYDMPEYFLRLDQFPMTASGKVLKRKLIEMLKRGELRPEFIGRGAKARGGENAPA